MHIKRKTCDIQTWKKRVFLDISSTSIDTLAPSLYQCAETVVSTTSAHPFQPLPSVKRLLPSCEPLYTTNTSHHKQEKLLYEYPLH
jgi:hypothetical protein